MRHAHPHMLARLSDGATTSVIDVLTDAVTGEERYLVLRVNGYWGQDVVAPYSTVWCVDADVHVALSGVEAATLPTYDPGLHGPAAGLHSRLHVASGR